MERQPVDPVAHRLRQATEPRNQQRHAGRQAFGCRERRAVPPQRRQRDGIDIGQQTADLARREGARQLDHAACVEGLQLLGEPRRHLAKDPDVQFCLGLLRRLHQQLRALVGIGGAEERHRQSLADAARPATATDLVPDLGLVWHRLPDHVHELRRIPAGQERTPHCARYRQNRGQAALRASPDLAQPLAVPLDVGAGGTGSTAAPVARTGADRAAAGEHVRAGADQPVVVGREVGGQSPGRGLVDQRRAEVVEVVEVHDLRSDPIQGGRERDPDRRIVEFSQWVAEVEQAVWTVVDADQAHAVLFPFDGFIGELGGGRGDRGVEHRHLPAAARELLGGQPGDGGAAAAVVPAEGGHHQSTWS